jgi:hypothetical protein
VHGRVELFLLGNDGTDKKNGSLWAPCFFSDLLSNLKKIFSSVELFLSASFESNTLKVKRSVFIPLYYSTKRHLKINTFRRWINSILEGKWHKGLLIFSVFCSGGSIETASDSIGVQCGAEASFFFTVFVTSSILQNKEKQIYVSTQAATGSFASAIVLSPPRTAVRRNAAAAPPPPRPVYSHRIFRYQLKKLNIV